VGKGMICHPRIGKRSNIVSLLSSWEWGRLNLANGFYQQPLQREKMRFGTTRRGRRRCLMVENSKIASLVNFYSLHILAILYR